MTDRDPIRDLWTNQPREDFAMSIDDIRTRASKLQSVVRRRNAAEYTVGAMLIVVFGAFAFVMPTPLAKLGSALIAAGVAFVLWQLRRQASAETQDETDITESVAQFYRRGLVRQRDALSRIWRWYLGPLVPGMVVFWLSSGAKAAEPVWGWSIAALGLVTTAAVFIAIAAANKRAAKQLQSEIETLDAACQR